MRNLAIYGDRYMQLQLAQSEKLVAASVDSEHGRIFFASDHCQIYWMDLSSDGQHIQHSMPLVETYDDRVEDDIVNIEYMIEMEAVVVALQSGDILLAHNSSYHVEVVGSLHGGIVAMEVSPDGELLAFITGLGQLIVMTAEWDPLYEVCICQGDIDSGVKNDLRHMQPAWAISWRPDGKYIATLDRSDDKPLKIWERDAGVLHASAETLPFPITAITWCPGGARIAAAGDRSDQGKQPLIVIFERNGLKKDSFEVCTLPDAKIESLQWNAGSDLMAISIRCANHDAIQVWNCNNYHWYLKQEWEFSKADYSRVLWQPEKSLEMIFWKMQGSMQVVCCDWNSAVLDANTAVVIDGKELLMTPLSICLIPPPMHLFKIKFHSPVTSVTFKSSNSGGSVLAVQLSDGILSVFQLPDVSTWSELEDKEYEEPVSMKGTRSATFSRYYHLTLLNCRTICGIAYATETGYSLVELAVEYPAGSGFDKLHHCEVTIRKETILDQPVIAITGSPISDRCSAYIQLQDGSVLEHFCESVIPSMHSGSFAKFHSASPWMAVALIKGTPKLVGLDCLGRLHVDGSVVNDDTTHFAIYGLADGQGSSGIPYLIYTTKHDFLHIVNLEELCKGSKFGTEDGDLSLLNIVQKHIVPTKAHDSVERRRVWERGSRLVAALSDSDGAVVLQTIRGNLETVYPRVLVLQAISSSLENFRFKDALLCARRHRIDLNVIIDLIGVDKFRSIVGQFVKQVNKLSLITELICALKPDNILESTYKNLLSQEKPLNGEQQSIFGCSKAAKVTIVLKSIRDVLQKEIEDSPARELCILTSLARDDPPMLEEALVRIKQLREKEMNDKSLLEMDISELDEPNVINAETAMKHLIWLCDSDAVFNAALGLYDLHLAAMVATHSQRDPKEFLPFLQELEDMSLPIMKYTIDCRLKRFQSALKHLALAGDLYFPECLQLIHNNPELFPCSLYLFKKEPMKYTILEAWGDYLLSQEKFEDAGAAFCTCSQFRKALIAYRSGGCWKAVFMTAGKLNFTSQELRSLSLEICEEMQAMGRLGEAARIALDYCKDVDWAIGLLIDAREWLEVLRIAYMLDKCNYIEARIEPAAMECANVMIVEFEEGIEKIGKYFARYTAICERRSILASKLQNEGLESTIDDDAASETSSNLSGMSAYTYGSRTSTVTSKARKKGSQGRKGRIRAGSPGEDLALVEHMKSMALPSYKIEELRRLLKALIFLGQQDIAKKLQQAASKFQDAQREAVERAEQVMIKAQKGSCVLTTGQPKLEGLVSTFEILKC